VYVDLGDAGGDMERLIPFAGNMDFFAYGRVRLTF
jgi:hypothetical protein